MDRLIFERPALIFLRPLSQLPVFNKITKPVPFELPKRHRTPELNLSFIDRYNQPVPSSGTGSDMNFLPLFKGVRREKRNLM
jgi:hypothetical protein